MSAPTHYRETTIGRALLGSLQEMINRGEISEDLANKCMEFFDESIEKKFAQVKDNGSKATVKSKLHTYNFSDNTWYFTLEDVKIENVASSQDPTKRKGLRLDYLKVTAVDSKLS
mmetsp:Transcript_13653/g.20550  ORF Transcript_13653/g.20550 Transcript_13653/m.20550 type:complete len:115 (-) Transcript_13653:301-645(-)